MNRFVQYLLRILPGDGSEKNRREKEKRKQTTANFLYRLIAFIQEMVLPKGKIRDIILHHSNEPSGG
jgi:hypothetical protein